MTPKTRRILFIVCVFLFLTVTPTVIFYSQGYRFDWNNRKIVKTGGLYFKILPRGAEIFLDGQSKKKTDLFFASALVDNLFPREYQIKITKSGYQAWQKTLKVEESKVTEIKNVFLIPQDLEFKEIGQKIEAFFISPDQTKIIIKETIIEQQEPSWALKLIDLKINVKSQVVNQTALDKNGARLESIVWSSGSDGLILKTLINEQEKYWLIDLKQNPPSLEPIDVPENTFLLGFHPIDPGLFVFSQKTDRGFNLFSLNAQNKNLPALLLKDILAWQIDEKNILFLSSDGFLERTGLNGQAQKLIPEPLNLKTEARYQIETEAGQIVLKEDNQYFYLDQTANRLEQINNGLVSLAVSPSLKKICFYNDYELWLFFTKEEPGQPSKEKNQKVFLTRFSDKIGRVFWFNDHYLLFSLKGKIKVIEIDDRDKIQSWELATIVDPLTHFNSKDGKLYVLSENRLLVSEKIE